MIHVSKSFRNSRTCLEPKQVAYTSSPTRQSPGNVFCNLLEIELELESFLSGNGIKVGSLSPHRPDSCVGLAEGTQSGTVHRSPDNSPLSVSRLTRCKNSLGTKRGLYCMVKHQMSPLPDVSSLAHNLVNCTSVHLQLGIWFNKKKATRLGTN